MKILYFTRSAPYVDSGGGGRRRTYQVCEALKATGSFEFITSFRPPVEILKKIDSKFRKVITKNFVTNGEYKLWSKDRRDALYRFRSIAREWLKSVPGLFAADLIFVEDPVYFKPLVVGLKGAGIPVIASCQNIESLSYGRVSFADKQAILYKELDILSLCDLTITISREDSWLLNNFGIKTYFFPYFPPPLDRQRLLKIRRFREKNKEKIKNGNILLLGNAGNIATRRGMKKVIDYWRVNSLSRSAGKLAVAGYKTDIFFKEVLAYPGIEFLGPLSNDELDKKLQAVKACLCYQEEGGGALTRICEMLLAGIPVLANFNAARTYANKQGVIEFAALEDLQRVLARDGVFAGAVPEPPRPDTAELITEIKKARGPVRTGGR
ncbi:MAG: glycosyltransferase family 4 protein [Candidatus Aminicenantes bacterium]|nr:glycosyltransferase family 4 protein [Candidatus Aminicenantes bacterium]